MVIGMRSAQLPPHLALCHSPCRHWIVSAGGGSESYQCFFQYKEHACERHVFPALTPLPPHSVARFRLDHLLPEDWSALLRHCRRLTSPHGSFTYSFPGDTAVATTAGDAASAVVTNVAFMHIVERTAGDFVPNNMIYHELQRRYLVLPCYTAETGTGAVDFTSWLRCLQQGEANMETECAADEGAGGSTDTHCACHRKDSTKYAVISCRCFFLFFCFCRCS
ncbi:putative Bis(5-adenosyl)-triphosphatase [Trypanosoma rangeli]|uniref:Putative Bis(5-adenosyl)-triphosphatase n=1 Tax=Trypanosoma rangeli TaxID=5698 RepID=A0A3R7MS75_TRYRA|nr:putative Bis(5-adenosyl)-triphosphatase [Trypanosoma rangeli]RNF07264.1 putative Bis(5-adenosyl)-triphosphatase [Trypanosoma rangeli]|eukprot:RNF07264.1 putative Bis(5-adenosyl)-triphosphatase [Trypanosoma rangeli]